MITAVRHAGRIIVSDCSYFKTARIPVQLSKLEKNDSSSRGSPRVSGAGRSEGPCVFAIN